MWFQSQVRIFAGVASILLALVSLVVSNFGGFLMGFLLALFGGALAVAWSPGTPAPDGPGDKAELPGAAPDSGGDEGEPTAPQAGPVVPAQGGEPFMAPETVPAGARSDEETTEKNGRHRAG
jgi:hypothetical protein